MSFRILQRRLTTLLSLSRHRHASRSLLTLSALLLLTLSTDLAAAPLTFPTLTTTQGVTYRDVKVSRFDALELRFSHANGVATVLLSDLPPDLQNIFGYNPLNASTAVTAKQKERVKTIITDADKKAKAAAIIDKEQADAAELKTIRASALRCFVNQLLDDGTDNSMLMEVSAVAKLPVKITSRSGRSERVKLTPQGKPELVEQAAPDQPFVLGNTLRILPKSTAVAPQSIISVYPIGTGLGEYPLCALSPEGALKYRRKLAALKATESPAPPPPGQPPAPAK